MLHQVYLLLAALTISIASQIILLERPIPGFVQIPAATLAKPITVRPPRVLSPYRQQLEKIQDLRANTYLLNEQFHDAKLSGGRFNEDRLRQSRSALQGTAQSMREKLGDDIARRESLLGRFTAKTEAGVGIEKQRQSDLDHLKTLDSGLQELLETPLKLTVRPLDGNN